MESLAALLSVFVVFELPPLLSVFFPGALSPTGTGIYFELL